MIRSVVIVLIAFLGGCAANQKVIENPSDKAAVSAKIYEVKTEFGEHRIYGPAIVKDFSGVLNTDVVSAQLMKTEDNLYYLRVHNYHSGNSWKFLESITTKKKETIRLKELSRELGTCLSSACAHTELGFAPLSKSRYLNGNEDLKFRINAKRWGTQVMTIPKQYIQAFIEQAG